MGKRLVCVAVFFGVTARWCTHWHCSLLSLSICVVPCGTQITVIQHSFTYTETNWVLTFVEKSNNNNFHCISSTRAEWIIFIFQFCFFSFPFILFRSSHQRMRGFYTLLLCYILYFCFRAIIIILWACRFIRWFVVIISVYLSDVWRKLIEFAFLVLPFSRGSFFAHPLVVVVFVLLYYLIQLILIVLFFSFFLFALWRSCTS